MEFKITKPIRLIETFAGIGSQAKALSNLGANFQHWKVIEFDQHCIDSYNAIHNTNFATKDITLTHAEDLEIIDRESYCYLLTYSFPCQDLSLAGKGAGMKKGSGTRSGLLWEIERILDECNGNLPQVLLMENVPQVHGKGNIEDFNKWLKKLEGLGYRNYWKDLNAKDFGIPQNRKRTFCVSILGDYTYEFPKEKELTLRLKDFLEKDVDEKFYLSEKMLNGMINTNFNSYNLKSRLIDQDGEAKTILARIEGCPQCVQDTRGGLPIMNNTKQGYLIANSGDGVNISSRMKWQRGNVQEGMVQTIKTKPDVGVVIDDKENISE